jgi:hypothetical protein
VERECRCLWQVLSRIGINGKAANHQYSRVVLQHKAMRSCHGWRSCTKRLERMPFVCVEMVEMNVCVNKSSTKENTSLTG